MRTAQNIFNEELSGEPLSEEVIVEAIKVAMKEAITESAKNAKAYLVQPTVNGGKRAVVNSSSILELIKQL